MKQLREVARLRYDLGCAYAEIAGSAGVARSTVQEALRRLRAAGLTWPLPAELDEDALYARLYPARPVCHAVEPDFAALSKELTRKAVARKLLWRECVEQHPGRVGATRSSARAGRRASGAAIR